MSEDLNLKPAAPPFSLWPQQPPPRLAACILALRDAFEGLPGRRDAWQPVRRWLVVDADPRYLADQLGYELRAFLRGAVAVPVPGSPVLCLPRALDALALALLPIAFEYPIALIDDRSLDDLEELVAHAAPSSEIAKAREKRLEALRRSSATP